MIHSFTKKLAIATTAAALIAVSAVGSFHEANAAMFSDVTNPDDYYYNAVEDLASRNILNGPGDGTFRPNNQMTRAEVSKVICKSLNIDTSNVTDPGFIDVHPGDWNYPYVSALVEKGVISKDRMFRPNDKISRAEISKMIVTAYQLQISSSSSSFIDVKPTDWFASYVNTFVEYGITKGATETTFDPNGKVTRGQAVTFIYRTEQALSGGPTDPDGDFDVIGIE